MISTLSMQPDFHHFLPNCGPSIHSFLPLIFSPHSLHCIFLSNIDTFARFNMIFPAEAAQ